MNRNPAEANVASSAKVLVVDDHLALAELLSQHLDGLPDFTSMGVTGDGGEALELICELRPDYVLLDLMLPTMGGLEIIQELERRGVSPRILVFSGLSNHEAVRHALFAGVNAFLEKGISLSELDEALRKVRAGEVHVSPSIADTLREIVCMAGDRPTLDLEEIKILRLLGAGRSAKAVAQEMGLCPSGVYKVMARVRGKAGVKDRAGEALFAANIGARQLPAVDLLARP
ncbi:response regulator [Synoicihabitans lomoniglobus]|uniref:Response regulator transcription factor n=1 Tax=Synoicihabitans lomoniglobus TaxID=2909285 RepID=A0AAF0CNU9_9BACT|nr:response regulator transcription factor [Opitutaceae bacterium LMO-M01]WED64880.1 response regulator transcription factor [Opitutaceae bacterium LMO-M01]